MLKSVLLLTGALTANLVVPAQNHSKEDSLTRETKRMITVVDSLRKRADQQDTIIESMAKMVELLSHSTDSASNGLAGWRTTYQKEMSGFDSTLARLDSCIGRLNKVTNEMDHLSSPKK